MPTQLLLPSPQHLLHQDLSRLSHQPFNLLSRHSQPRQEATPLPRPIYEVWIAKHPRPPSPVNSEAQRQALRRGLSFDNRKRALGWGKNNTLCAPCSRIFSKTPNINKLLFIVHRPLRLSVFFLRTKLLHIQHSVWQSEHNMSTTRDLLIGCVGKPSAGKSSFLNAATDANAKVGKE